MKSKKNEFTKNTIVKNWEKNDGSRSLSIYSKSDVERSRIKAIDHCCQMMTLGVNDQRIFISYVPLLREYVINLMHSRGVQQLMFHCPWCGYQLPRNLRDEYFSILEKEYSLDDPCDEEQKKRIPEEFKSDEWWKKRGL